jgi:flagellar motor switch protein FliM
MSESLSQADLDALFGDLSSLETEPEAEGGAGECSEISMEVAWEPPPSVSDDAGEVLSQDDIDKLLAQFGS